MSKKSKTAAADQGRAAKPSVIATRRSCAVRGTGLSHYISMDKKAK